MADPSLPDFGARLLADESRCVGETLARGGKIVCVRREKCLRFVQIEHDRAGGTNQPVPVAEHLCTHGRDMCITARWPRFPEDLPLSAPVGDHSSQSDSLTPALPAGALSRNGDY